MIYHDKEDQSSSWPIYRLNPFTNGWEYWEASCEIWVITITYTPHNMRLNKRDPITDGRTVLEYINTWAEPFFGMNNE